MIRETPCPFHDLGLPLEIRCNCADYPCPVCGVESDWVTVVGTTLQLACPEGHPDWSKEITA